MTEYESNRTDNLDGLPDTPVAGPNTTPNAGPDVTDWRPASEDRKPGYRLPGDGWDASGIVD